MSVIEWFVTCPKGLEGLLADELNNLGAEAVRQTRAGVYASGPLSLAYRICLWSRLANRLLLPLARLEVGDGEAIYRQVSAIPWQAHLSPAQTLAVDFTGTSDQIRHTRFGAQRVKDAVVDVLKAHYDARPNVALKSPDIRINAHLAKGRLTVSLDLSGDSLHKRGYRVAMVPAPLKENLAAALLIRAGWPAIGKAGGALIDPLCGSGTLLIEGAMMAADIAPGLQRPVFGFQGWLQHQPSLWQELRGEAVARREAGLASGLPEIRGYDKDSRAVQAAQANIAAIGLEAVVRISAKPLTAFKKPTHRPMAAGLVICNPPYGERWGDVEQLRPLYQSLGEVVKHECPGWRLAVISGNADLMSELRLRALRKHPFFNGTMPAQLALFDIRADAPAVFSERPPAELGEGAQMFANRLQKNARKLQPWLKHSGTDCYRLYDRDIPEYAVAVDKYGTAIHVQEYAPPASVDEGKAHKHLNEVKQVLMALYPQSQGRLFFKERRRQRGHDQYKKLTRRADAKAVFTVSEGAARLQVNLADYLDTGLFLDHRPVRAMLAELAKGKRFLNLFCYTAAATVQAALGGARQSLSLDMSNSYLDWAKRNFALNNLDESQHLLQRADCLQWLREAKGVFDVIFMDPPTFSNSKKMDAVLDIQCDHATLIQEAMGLLAADGVLVFSTNFRRFKMSSSIAEAFDVQDITAKTIPPDFSRNAKIHQCWLIRPKTLKVWNKL